MINTIMISSIWWNHILRIDQKNFTKENTLKIYSLNYPIKLVLHQNSRKEQGLTSNRQRHIKETINLLHPNHHHTIQNGDFSGLWVIEQPLEKMTMSMHYPLSIAIILQDIAPKTSLILGRKWISGVPWWLMVFLQLLKWQLLD